MKWDIYNGRENIDSRSKIYITGKKAKLAYQKPTNIFIDLNFHF